MYKTQKAMLLVSFAMTATLFVVAPEKAVAKDLHTNRTAVSGKTTKMFQYGSWGARCEPKRGVVKVLTKPQHGKLSAFQTTGIAKSNRYNPNDPCLGKPFNAFQVDYTSHPNFGARTPSRSSGHWRMVDAPSIPLRCR